MRPKYYFAYGSNLNLSDFHKYCSANGYNGAKLKIVGNAFAIDHVMQFHYYSSTRGGGTADILADALGFAVPGIIFEPNLEAWKALDEKEGRPSCYDLVKLHNVALTNLSDIVDCATYTVIEESKAEEFIKPSVSYLKIIRTGLLNHRLSLTMLERASKDFVDVKKEEANIRNVFVYGTLRKEGYNAKKMEASNFVLTHSNCFITGKLYDTGYGFPGAVATSDNSIILGEMYEYSGNLTDLVINLDELEGYDASKNASKHKSMYRRVITQVTSQSRTTFAWTYAYNRDVSELKHIENGDWIKYEQI